MTRAHVLSLAILGLVVALAGPTWAATTAIDLTWNAVTTNDNGTPITDLAGYKMYRATGACLFVGPLQPALNAAGTHITTTATTLKAVDDNIPKLDGKLAYHVTAYDTAGNESVRSNCAEVTVNNLPPNAPSGLNAVGR